MIGLSVAITKQTARRLLLPLPLRYLLAGVLAGLSGGPRGRAR